RKRAAVESPAEKPAGAAAGVEKALRRKEQAVAEQRRGDLAHSAVPKMVLFVALDALVVVRRDPWRERLCRSSQRPNPRSIAELLPLDGSIERSAAGASSQPGPHSHALPPVRDHVACVVGGAPAVGRHDELSLRSGEPRPPPAEGAIRDDVMAA